MDVEVVAQCCSVGRLISVVVRVERRDVGLLATHASGVLCVDGVLVQLDAVDVGFAGEGVGGDRESPGAGKEVKHGEVAHALMPAASSAPPGAKDLSLFLRL